MDKQVIIYSTPTCHFCTLVKEYLKEKGVEYTEHNVAEDLEKRKEMVEKSGQMGVPVVFIGEDMVIGFDQTKIDSLLGLS